MNLARSSYYYQIKNKWKFLEKENRIQSLNVRFHIKIRGFNFKFFRLISPAILDELIRSNDLLWKSGAKVRESIRHKRRRSVMSKKRYSAEEIIQHLRTIELE